MDTKKIYNTFLSFLMIAAVLLSYSMEGVYPSNSVSVDSSQSSFHKKAYQTKLVKDQPSGVKQGDEQSAPTKGASTVITSCNTVLQVIPVEKQHLKAPTESSLTFPPYISSIPSQAFVFLEPDPPQIV